MHVRTYRLGAYLCILLLHTISTRSRLRAYLLSATRASPHINININHQHQLLCLNERDSSHRHRHTRRHCPQPSPTAIVIIHHHLCQMVPCRRSLPLSHPPPSSIIVHRHRHTHCHHIRHQFGDPKPKDLTMNELLCDLEEENDGNEG